MKNILNNLVKVVYARADEERFQSDYNSAWELKSKNLPQDPLATKFSNVGDIVGKLLPYVYVVAGLSLLIMLILGGITLMTAAGNPDKAKAGYGKIMAGLIGFLIIFISYFVLQIIEVMLGVKII